MHLTQSLHRNVQQHRDDVATVFGDRVMTWGESRERVAQLAAGLVSLGVRPGDRVGMLGLNSDRYHEYLFATWWAGAVVNPINIRWSPAEIGYGLRDSGTQVLFVDDTFLPLLPALLSEASGVTTVVHCGDQQTPDGMVAYDSLLGQGSVEDASVGGDALARLFHVESRGGVAGR